MKERTPKNDDDDKCLMLGEFFPLENKLYNDEGGMEVFPCYIDVKSEFDGEIEKRKLCSILIWKMKSIKFKKIKIIISWKVLKISEDIYVQILVT